MKSTVESDQVQPDLLSRIAYEEGLKAWMRDYDFRYYFTLTYRSDILPEKARSDLKYLQERLSKMAFGSGWKYSSESCHKVSFVASLERNKSGRIHIHVAMQSLEHSRRLKDHWDVKSAVNESWKRVSQSGYQLDFQLINRSKDHVVSYLFKEVKYDTDSFYTNCFEGQQQLKPEW